MKVSLNLAIRIFEGNLGEIPEETSWGISEGAPGLISEESSDEL